MGPSFQGLKAPGNHRAPCGRDQHALPLRPPGRAIIARDLSPWIRGGASSNFFARRANVPNQGRQSLDAGRSLEHFTLIKLNPVPAQQFAQF